MRLSFILDGAALTKYLSHLLAGVKIVNTRAKDPFSNEPLLLNSKFQLRELCFPMKILFATDTKKAYEVVMRDLFDYIDKVEKVGLPYSSEFGPAMRPFDVMVPADMAATWKMCAAGGGSYSTKDFCPQCSCKNHDRGTPAHDVDRCERCVLRDIKCCYDQPVLDSAELAKYKDELLQSVTTNIPSHYAKFDLIRKKSLIRPLTVTTNQVGAANDKFSIKFNTDSRDDEVVAEYNQLLMAELLIRYPNRAFQYGILGIEERRECLLVELRIEKIVAAIRLALERSEAVAAIALILVEQAMPCLLHCENRVNEKIFHTLVNNGIMRYGDTSGDKRTAYVAALTNVMKTSVLGTYEFPAQWRLRLGKCKKLIEKENLTNTEARKYITGIHDIIATVFSPEMDQEDNKLTRDANEAKKLAWTNLADLYHDLMDMARMEEVFTDVEIDEFHDLCGLFMDAWVQLNGYEHVTNYIHYIGSGHLVYYLRKFGNLYRYSNQGWEALNQKIKRYYMNNTNHGGNVGGKRKIKLGHVEPLWLFFARNTLWKTGHGDQFFSETAE